MDQKVDPTLQETIASTGLSLPSSSSPSGAAAAPSRISAIFTPDEGRFVPGTLLGGRYRVIGLLGRGGMGEVYRATDLTLGQSVALKFLPESASRNQALLERFHSEVRIARQVSHPNVCRVYDIGEVDGTPFISMEYVDGEDLASLLQRIGRLPSDKALEVARKVCAGLSAAHDRGIIHRDLKPQNIMMNKRGEVLIMDFGLAGIADQLTGAEVRNGTPAYMAPEQLKGWQVTAKSDIYALGLVLYELFTGKRPYEGTTLAELLTQQESGHLTSMTAIATDVDPAVEKVIRRCLDPDPARRPGSALLIAAALPGGDPLAAALAAGETPSPELVASAGKTEGLERRYSIPCLVLVTVCLFVNTIIHQRNYAPMRTHLDLAPDVLAQDSREVARTFGYTQRPADSTVSIASRHDLLNYLNKLPQPHKWNEWLDSEATIQSEYRESLSPLLAKPSGVVTPDEPAPIKPGMARVVLDGHGHLREFSAVPYSDAETPKGAVQPDTVFRAAGLDPSNFSETTPSFVPRFASDQLRSWTGKHPALPNTDLKVEFASWKGQVTHARIVFPWESQPSTARGVPPYWENTILFLVGWAMLMMILLARRNWKLGRTDKRGALRVAAFRFVLAGIGWIGTTHFVPNSDMIDRGLTAVSEWLFSGALIWLLYLALEPALRARWPHSIVTWNRLLSGKWLDAQVGAHILIGATVGLSLWIAADLADYSARSNNNLDAGGNWFFALGTREWIGGHANQIASAFSSGLIIFFCMFGMKMLFRNDILAAIVAGLLFTFSNGNVFGSSQFALTVAIYATIYAVLLFLLLRLGLVATIASCYFLNMSNAIMLGSDWTTWYAPSAIATIVLLLGIAVFAFWRSLGDRELLSTTT